MSLEFCFFALLFLSPRLTNTKAVDGVTNAMKPYFDLTIIHTNDVHSRFLSYNSNVQPCTKKDLAKNKCWGGAARRATAIKRLRALYNNTVLLDAGNQFQGSVWYTLLKWRPVAEYLNLLNYTAMTFGNHEFDNGDENLAEFVQHLNFPVISSNVKVREPSVLAGLYKEFDIIVVNGEKIGLTGVTTTETPEISLPSRQVKFFDLAASLNEAVKKLKNAHNINKIIALSHSGVETDVAICRDVPDLDVIVGGHSRTFLYSGSTATSQKQEDIPEGPYPIVVTRKDHTPCLVVQASVYGKYLGFLQVQFDPNGIVTNWNGNPILIDAHFCEDPQMLTLLKRHRQNLTHLENMVVATTNVTLTTNEDICRVEECAVGNLVTDAMLEHTKIKLRHHNFARDHWENTTGPIFGFAAVNGGSLRQFSISKGSNITLANIYSLLPFSNNIKLLKLSGSTVRQMFEKSIDKFSTYNRHGKFLQISGARVEYRLACNGGDDRLVHKVSSLYVSCLANCLGDTTSTAVLSPGFGSSAVESTMYESVNDNKTYLLVSITYMADGGDGYTMLRNSTVKMKQGEDLDVYVVLEHMQKVKSVVTETEGRIRLVKQPNCK